MKRIFLALVLALVSIPSVFATDFDSLYSADKFNFTGTEGIPAIAPALAKAPGVIETVKTMPMLDLMAERAGASAELQVGATVFLATVTLDDEWEMYFQLRRKGSQAASGAWKEAALADGVTYRFDGGEVSVTEEDGKIAVAGSSGTAETSIQELVGRLYEKSSRIELGGLVSYAVIRNLTPLTNNEGTITLRLGSDGLYYYSLTPDSMVASNPRWLLAVNGVLYGLKVVDTDVVFVSKVIPPGAKPAVQKEKVFKY